MPTATENTGIDAPKCVQNRLERYHGETETAETTTKIVKSRPSRPSGTDGQGGHPSAAERGFVQYVKGLAHHNPNDAEALSRRLRQITGFLWHGDLHDGQAAFKDLAVDLDDIETDYASIKALQKAAPEFETYIANNNGMTPNYAERRRYGERVSTGFVESTVNTIVSKRQKMRWSKHGALLMLQTRSRTLDGALRGRFEQKNSGTRTTSGAPG